MWTKETRSEVSASSPALESRLSTPPSSASANIRPSSPAAHTLSCLGSTIEVKGEISCGEDLQINGKIEGPISIRGHRLTVGRTAHLSSEIIAREVIVYGKVAGNLHAGERVEIKKDGDLTGDIKTARISIEDGAHFKGSIEIDRAQSTVQGSLETDEAPVGTAAD